MEFSNGNPNDTSVFIQMEMKWLSKGNEMESKYKWLKSKWK